MYQKNRSIFFLLMILFIISCKQVFAQVEGTGLLIKNWPLNISYFGVGITHPGLKLSTEIPVRGKIRDARPFKKLKGFEMDYNIPRDRMIRKYFYFRPDLTFYYHGHNHSAFILGANYAKRRIGRRGNIREFSAGLAYMRTFNSGVTYEVNNDIVTTVPFAGNNYLTPKFSAYIGRDLSYKSGFVKGWYAGPTLFFLIPYNHLFSTSYSIELGIRL